MDKDLAKLTVYVDGPTQIPDILAKIPTKSGGDVWLILHIEIQGAEGGDLPERMFYYNLNSRSFYNEACRLIPNAASISL